MSGVCDQKVGIFPNEYYSTIENTIEIQNFITSRTK